MRLVISFLLICLYQTSTFSQNSIKNALSKFNNNTVTYISVEELKSSENLVLLDTRKKEEFDVSKLKGATWVGYKEFKINTIQNNFPDKTTPIVVYCSIGVRSEDIGEKLKKAGYSNVRNLYGGIFEWKNKNNPVYNTQNKETEKVHTFSKQWSKLLTKGEKIYTTKSYTIE